MHFYNFYKQWLGQEKYEKYYSGFSKCIDRSDRSTEESLDLNDWVDVIDD